jgi:hypothetical protein
MVVVSISLGSAVIDYFFYFLHLYNPSRIVHLQYIGRDARVERMN